MNWSDSPVNLHPCLLFVGMHYLDTINIIDININLIKELLGSRKFLSLLLKHATLLDSGGPLHTRQSACNILASASLKTSPTTNHHSFGAELLKEGTILPAAYSILCVRFTSLVPCLHNKGTSARRATLDTGGWLSLTRQGLSPCKKRQASLAAPTRLSKNPFFKMDCWLRRIFSHITQFFCLYSVAQCAWWPFLMKPPSAVVHIGLSSLYYVPYNTKSIEY